LALDNIIERFYDFDQIELAIAVLLTFSHEDLFPGRCKIIEFFYDDYDIDNGLLWYRSSIS